MRRLLNAVLAAALLAPPALAYAHDPLDDQSGEEELERPNKDEDKPVSHKKVEQEGELAKEVQERDDTEFHLNQEKDEFLRDRAETKDVKAAQKRRSELGGSAGRSHAAAPAPQPDPGSEPAAKKPPSDTSDETDAKPVEEQGAPVKADAPAKKKKKKH